MASNATILIVVTAMAVLVLTGACALVVYKMRTKGDSARGLTLRTQIDEDLSRFRRQEELADELDARVIAERGELDVRTVSE